jgi:hypothetical protein
MTNLIYAYTRSQAIEDGFQMKLEGEEARMAQQLYKYPVYLTGGVNEMIEQAVANKKHCNDRSGVLWDILWMSRNGRPLNEQTTQFTVIITGVGRRKKHTMLIRVGPTDIDDPKPAITIMLPSDD